MYIINEPFHFMISFQDLEGPKDFIRNIAHQSKSFLWIGIWANLAVAQCPQGTSSLILTHLDFSSQVSNGWGLLSFWVPWGCWCLDNKAKNILPIKYIMN